MRNQYIKIYGERNTGTNYVDRLLTLNFYVQCVPGVVPKQLDKVLRRLPFSENLRDFYFQMTIGKNLGWKHRELDEETLDVIDENKDRVKFIALVKNPYSWLLSLDNRPYHVQGQRIVDFERFATSPWKTVGRETLQKQYDNPVEMWNKKVASYIRLKERADCMLIKYEDLLKSPELQLEWMSESLNLCAKPEFPCNYSKPAKSSDAGKTRAYYLEYYGQEKWRERLTNSDVGRVNECLDKKLMDKLGYEII